MILRPVLRPVLRSLLMDDDGPSPAFSASFMSGILPAGLTYTNSSTTRTYFGSDGLLKTAVANEPIFETLGGVPQGMRWEMEQRTNLALYSTLQGGGAAPTGWSQPSGTGTSAPVASIYGNADGAVAYEQVALAGERPYFLQAVTVSANTTYTASVLVESVTGEATIGDALYSGSFPSGTRTFKLNGVSKLSTDALTVGTVEMQLAIGATGGSTTARAGVGAGGLPASTVTVKFSRPQFEVGASRSSFIPTTGAAVIRQPDVLTATSISPWYRQDEGTVVFEGIASAPATAQRGIYLFSDGTDNERISAYRASGLNGGVLVVDGGVTQADINSLSSIAQNSIFRHALAYKLNDLAGSVNNGAPVVDTSATMPTVTALTMGQGNTAGTQAFMGYARRFQYYNTRLPNAQIQGLSRV